MEDGSASLFRIHSIAVSPIVWYNGGGIHEGDKAGNSTCTGLVISTSSIQGSGRGWAQGCASDDAKRDHRAGEQAGAFGTVVGAGRGGRASGIILEVEKRQNHL